MLRFAPSPTGDMHINNLRVAILNYLVSQQINEQFLVRIEDMDTKHNIEGKDTEIMMILEKFAIKHNAVFHQSQHLNLYQTLALRLLKEEKAFICTCADDALVEEKYSGHCEHLTQKDYTVLKESSKKFLIRLKKPEKSISHNDIISANTTTTPDEVDAFIILKRDGTPTYDFACAADDMMSNVDFIIRSEKYLSNTAKQIHIKNLLAYQNETNYAHIPSILNHDKVPSLKHLFQEGFIPDAILNYLLLLDNPNAPKEIFSLPEAIEWFDLNSISKFALKFDMEKLRYINNEHLKIMDDKQLSSLFGFADTAIGKLAKVYLAECNTSNELEEKIRPIFTAKNFQGAWGEEMKIIADIIASAPAFETFDELIKHITSQSGLNDEHLFKPLRYLLTNTGNGPELSEIYPLIKSYILEVAS